MSGRIDAGVLDARGAPFTDAEVAAIEVREGLFPAVEVIDKLLAEQPDVALGAYMERHVVPPTVRIQVLDRTPADLVTAVEKLVPAGLTANIVQVTRSRNEIAELRKVLNGQYLEFEAAYLKPEADRVVAPSLFTWLHDNGFVPTGTLSHEVLSTITIYVDPASPAVNDLAGLAELMVASPYAELADVLIFEAQGREIEAQGRTDSPGPMRAGLRIGNTALGTTCSTSISVSLAGHSYLVTAGHCATGTPGNPSAEPPIPSTCLPSGDWVGDSVTHHGYVVGFYSSMVRYPNCLGGPADLDYALIHLQEEGTFPIPGVGGFASPYYLYVNLPGSPSINNSGAITTVTTPALGAIVCMQGASDRRDDTAHATTCGQITGNNPGEYLATDVYACRGDSGGLLSNGGTANASIAHGVTHAIAATPGAPEGCAYISTYTRLTRVLADTGATAIVSGSGVISPSVNPPVYAMIRPRHASPAQCLNAVAGSTANGTLMEQWACLPANADGERWAFVPHNDGTGDTYLIRRFNTASPPACIDIPGAVLSIFVPTRLQEWTCNTAAVQQRWRLVSNASASPQFFSIRTMVNTAWCLDIQGSGNSSGTPLVMWPCSGTNGTNNQQFRIES